MWYQLSFYKFWLIQKKFQDYDAHANDSDFVKNLTTNTNDHI